jgi:DNA polymerase II large subunit
MAKEDSFAGHYASLFDPKELKLLEDKAQKEFLKGQELFETNIEEEEVKALSEALAIDYAEKWKVYARMKVAERNFERSENIRASLTQKLIHANANLEVTLKTLEEKKVAVAYELREKEKAKTLVRELRAELKSLKKPKEVSKRSAPEKKSAAKNA